MDLNKTLKYFVITIVSLVIINIISLSQNLLINSRPPYVIRINPDGQAQVLSDNHIEALPGEREALFFSKEFLIQYMEYDYQTVTETLSMSMVKMTDEFREVNMRAWKEKIREIESQKIKTVLYFKDLAANIDERGEYIVHFRLMSEMLLKGKKSSFKTYKGTIYLNSVDRSEYNPFGLAVRDMQVRHWEVEL
ncbi:MAG: hypothetical protein KDK51_06780 [Deltaproteobacteria bacterium]|nr:hypothetical protein [Deltaproteobacteria bacterium]